MPNTNAHRSCREETSSDRVRQPAESEKEPTNHHGRQSGCAADLSEQAVRIHVGEGCAAIKGDGEAHDAADRQ